MMEKSFKIEFTKYSKADVNLLDGSQKKHIRKSLQKVKQNGMNVGQSLRGKLSDCRKITHKKLGLRVVFRQSEKGIEIIEIVVIGKREDGEVYDIARKRLNR